MARIDDILPKEPEQGLSAYSKQCYDSPVHQEKIKREEKEVECQERAKEKATESGW
jgi:hypothetical protein